jgi:hypothetical protein
VHEFVHHVNKPLVFFYHKIWAKMITTIWRFFSIYFFIYLKFSLSHTQEYDTLMRRKKQRKTGEDLRIFQNTFIDNSKSCTSTENSIAIKWRKLSEINHLKKTWLKFKTTKVNFKKIKVVFKKIILSYFFIWKKLNKIFCSLNFQVKFFLNFTIYIPIE